MITRISNLVFEAGARNLDVKYGENDFNSMKQEGAVSVTQISVYEKDAPKKEYFFAAVGIDKHGNLMIQQSDMAANPCLPYCYPPQNFVEIDQF